MTLRKCLEQAIAEGTSHYKKFLREDMCFYRKHETQTIYRRIVHFDKKKDGISVFGMIGNGNVN